MSEQILLLNPRRRKRRHNRRARAKRVSRRRTTSRRRRMPAALRRYWASKRGGTTRRRRRSTSRRKGRHYMRRRRRAPARRYARRANRRRVHARRSNPRFLRGGMTRARGIIGDLVVPAAIAGTGAVVLDVAWGYLSPRLPITFQSGWAALLAKLGVVVAGTMIVNKVRPGWRSQTHTAAVGAVTVLAYGAIKGMAQSVLGTKVPGLSGYMDYQSFALPGTRMGGYMPSGLGSLGDWFSPAAVIQPAGTAVPQQFGGYMPRQMAGYVAAQPHMTGAGGFMGYDWNNDGM